MEKFPISIDLDYYKFERYCNMQDGNLYIPTITDCDKGEILDLNDLFSKVQGYDGTVAQTLGHDASGKLIRS